MNSRTRAAAAALCIMLSAAACTANEPGAVVPPTAPPPSSGSSQSPPQTPSQSPTATQVTPEPTGMALPLPPVAQELITDMTAAGVKGAGLGEDADMSTASVIGVWEGLIAKVFVSDKAEFVPDLPTGGSVQLGRATGNIVTDSSGGSGVSFACQDRWYTVVVYSPDWTVFDDPANATVLATDLAVATC